MNRSSQKVNNFVDDFVDFAEVVTSTCVYHCCCDVVWLARYDIWNFGRYILAGSHRSAPFVRFKSDSQLTSTTSHHQWKYTNMHEGTKSTARTKKTYARRVFQFFHLISLQHFTGNFAFRTRCSIFPRFARLCLTYDASATTTRWWASSMSGSAPEDIAGATGKYKGLCWFVLTWQLTV